MAIAISEMKEEDLSHGFLETLKALAEVELTVVDAAKVLRDRLRAGMRTYVARNGKLVIGTATLMIERKFTHRGGCAGHIEDVAVNREAQGQGIGAALVQHAVEEARRLGCYKVILDCTDDLMPFYARLGFRRHNNGMRLDF